MTNHVAGKKGGVPITFLLVFQYYYHEKLKNLRLPNYALIHLFGLGLGVATKSFGLSKSLILSRHSMFMLACCLSELLSISEQDYGKHTQASIKLTKHPSKTNILPTLS